MFTTREKRGAASIELTHDEQQIVLFLRTLHIDREEAVRRLATAPLRPVLPGGQELHANLSAVSQDPLDGGVSTTTRAVEADVTKLGR